MLLTFSIFARTLFSRLCCFSSEEPGSAVSSFGWCSETCFSNQCSVVGQDLRRRGEWASATSTKNGRCCRRALTPTGYQPFVFTVLLVAAFLLHCPAHPKYTVRGGSLVFDPCSGIRFNGPLVSNSQAGSGLPGPEGGSENRRRSAHVERRSGLVVRTTAPTRL